MLGEGARPGRCGNRFVWICPISTPWWNVCTPELGTVLYGLIEGNMGDRGGGKPEGEELLG